MRITPLDIYQQEFRRVLRGVDPDEVEDFLERVADDYEQLTRENTALKGRIDSLEAPLAVGGKTEQPHISETAAKEDVSSTLREARKEADNLVREARREADNVIHKAREEADRLKHAAEEIPEETIHEETGTDGSELLTAKVAELELRREISRLRAQKERFLVEYRELLEKHLKLLTEEV